MPSRPRIAFAEAASQDQGALHNMVVDRDDLSANLARFYDFTGKTVLYVGAGGGQLLGPASGIRDVVAIDSDAKSLEGLRRESRSKWKGVAIRFVPRGFESVDIRGDVAYFEFCLHEMSNPRMAIDRARLLAPDVVVMDHLPESKWIFYGAEEAQVLKSFKAIESAGIRSQKRFRTEQRFKDYGELAARLAGQGDLSLQRAASLKGAKDIKIQMDYGLFLL